MMTLENRRDGLHCVETTCEAPVVSQMKGPLGFATTCEKHREETRRFLVGRLGGTVKELPL